jgi:thymidylate synthase (FAD)
MKEELIQPTLQTKRAVSPELEAILGDPIKVLDHGFVRVVDYMGDDSAIVQAARVSYGTGTKQVSQDRGLILYLMRHRHTTPFEMCEIKFHVKLPIFVARQWIRHRTANVNEYSARYSIAPREFYLPAKEHIAVQSTNNKQGRGEPLSSDDAERVLSILRDDSQRCYDHYEELINEDSKGNIIDASKPRLARELARMNLTLNCYTEWYWKIDLHNLLHFLKLRADQHAQYEIRAYADVMIDIVKRWAPIAFEAFEEYSMHGVYVSRKAIAVLQKMLAGHNVLQTESGLTKREWEEVMSTFSKQ